MNSQRHILVIGATSAIAVGVATIYARSGGVFYLVARNEERVRAVATTLMAAGAGHVHVHIVDCVYKEHHDAIMERAWKSMGAIDIAIVAFGVLPNNQQAIDEVDIALQTLMVNTVATVSLLHRCALAMKTQGHGTIAVLGSVAGDRSRKSLVAYSASKAGTNSYADALRMAMKPHNVHIVTIKPGPIRTPLINNRSMPLIAEVQDIAPTIVRAIEKKSRTLYVPGIWRLIMSLVKLVPERILEKSSL
jgi:decaprenylphospho-beta-D-erythro-pentofuranosid-2-ulose 2-reductase